MTIEASSSVAAESLDQPSAAVANMCSCPTSSSTPTPPSPSWTARPRPRSWRRRRSRPGTRRWRSWTTTGSRARWSSRRRPSRWGCGPSTGVEMDLRRTSRHVTLLVENAVGWRNLCRIVTRAHVHDRDPHEPPPAVPLETLEEHAAGLVLPERVRGSRRPRRADAAAAAGGVRPRPPAGRAAAPVPAPRPRAQPRARAAGASGSGVPTVATGNVHVHARTRAPLQDAFVALRHHLTLDSSEPVRRGNTAHVLASPKAMAARFEGHARRGGGERRARRAADGSTSRRTSATAIRGRRTRRRRASSPSCAGRCSRCAIRPARPNHGAAHARLDEELRVIDALGLAGFFLLHRDLLELAREVAVEVRGPRIGPGAAAAGARARVVGVLDRLLPHRPLAHRSDRQRPVPRPLPERGAQRAAGHRSGLPARRAREADPARARPLRQAALGAGGGVPDVPLARGDPRARARCSGCRRGSSSGWRAAPSRGRSRTWGATSRWRWGSSRRASRARSSIPTPARTRSR